MPRKGFNGPRRSRLEMLMNILASSAQPPGRTITEIISEQSMSGAAARRLVDLLLGRGMIRSRRLPTSPSGMRMECTYYAATERGHRLLRAWRTLQRELEART